MNFNERIMRAYPPLPFYLAYPEFHQADNGASTIQDFEYLQQTYPQTARKFQRRISGLLDKMDYDGSMIYDEYPDKVCIMKLSDTIVDILQQEGDVPGGSEIEPIDQNMAKEIVSVLLCNEIYKRRHCKKRSWSI